MLTAPDSLATGGANEAGDLKEILAIVRRRRWLVVFAGICGSAVAAYFAYVAKPVFLATASVRIADARQVLSGGIADAPRDNIGSTYWVDPVLSQIQVLKSREVAAEAVRRHPLGLVISTDGFPSSDLRDIEVDSAVQGASLPVVFSSGGFVIQGREKEISGKYGEPVFVDGAQFSIAARPSHISGRIDLLSTNKAVDVLLEAVDARPRKSTDVVDITYRAHDPFVAQQVVNTIVASYKAVNADISHQQSRRRLEFIQEQL